tara:strand:- start:4638 stop:4910 length:273 start_codon:yes stop_codon:yes gene_type:complete
MYIKNIGKVSLMSVKDKKKLFNQVTSNNQIKKVNKNIPLKLKKMAKKHRIRITFLKNKKRFYKSQAQIRKQIQLKKKRVMKKRKKVKRKK